MSDQLEERVARLEKTLGTLIAWQFGVVLGADAIKGLLDMLAGIEDVRDE